jgi:hypothetical protein
MTTVNGCWNCEYGGLEKLLINLVYSQHGFKQVKPVRNATTISRKCGTNASLNVEPGFICEQWKYDEKGYRAETTPEEIEIMLKIAKQMGETIPNETQIKRSEDTKTETKKIETETATLVDQVEEVA